MCVFQSDLEQYKTALLDAGCDLSPLNYIKQWKWVSLLLESSDHTVECLCNLKTTTLVLNSFCIFWSSSRLIFICFITHFICSFTKAPSVMCRLCPEWFSVCWAEHFVTLTRSGFLQLFQGVYQDGRHPSQLRQQWRQTHGVSLNTRWVLWHSLIERVLDRDAPMASSMTSSYLRPESLFENQLFLQMAPLILQYVFLKFLFSVYSKKCYNAAETSINSAGHWYDSLH